MVYNHFATREGAYLACVRRARESYQQRLVEHLLEYEEGPRERLAAGADCFFGEIEQDPGRWRLLFGSNAVLPGEYAHELAELRFETIPMIEALLRR